ncbi:MAG: M2 family metallopeptidase [Deltaproteobacteria bacterium]|nr:M2 family metallopeptidase [Deltaproteobacteria bacterium]
MKPYALVAIAACTLLFSLPEIASAQGSRGPATVEEAATFIADTEQGLLRKWIDAERAEWVRMTYITHDTQAIAARAYEAMMEYVARKAGEATRFAGLTLPYELKRKFHLLTVSLSMPAPQDAAKREELAKIGTTMDGIYGKGKHCPERLKGRCLTLPEMYEVLATSRDYDELLDVWQGWRKVSLPMRDLFVRFVDIVNEGAEELGFSNLAELWNSRYDMDAEDFEAETDRLWGQVKPLYLDLHCHVRAKLAECYGEDMVPLDGPIPAHLLGNMWAQEWSNLFDMLAPEKATAIDISEALKAKKVDEKGMVKYAENFFVSLGMPPLPESFWERSMFTKPRDREVVCHASAWDVDQKDDLRIKMCIHINGEDFTTIHHELGHNYYQRAYNHLDPLFLNSANDGFHEALGDLIALSVTPSYLKQVDLLDEAPPGYLNPLMKRALDKIAFLPWGLMVDKWRWKVFDGRIPADEYNQAWWDLRERYQGVKAPVKRTENDFDPGAKYHIPANVPYTRYFLAAILQFQFHRALCRQVVKFEGPLHECSIYGNKEAGDRIMKMMKMGLSRPWPDAMEVMTGGRRMNADAIIEYFKPLHDWLKEQNKDRQCGW